MEEVKEDGKGEAGGEERRKQQEAGSHIVRLRQSLAMALDPEFRSVQRRRCTAPPRTHQTRPPGTFNSHPPVFSPIHRHQRLTWAHRHAQHLALMRGDGVERHSRAHVPDLDGLVVRGRTQMIFLLAPAHCRRTSTPSAWRANSHRKSSETKGWARGGANLSIYTSQLAHLRDVRRCAS